MNLESSFLQLSGCTSNSLITGEGVVLCGREDDAVTWNWNSSRDGSRS